MNKQVTLAYFQQYVIRDHVVINYKFKKLISNKISNDFNLIPNQLQIDVICDTSKPLSIHM